MDLRFQQQDKDITAGQRDLANLAAKMDTSAADMMKVAHEVGRHAEADALRLTTKLSDVEAAVASSAASQNQRIAGLEAAQADREKHFLHTLEKSEASFSKRLQTQNHDHAAKLERLTATFEARLEAVNAAAAKAAEDLTAKLGTSKAASEAAAARLGQALETLTTKT